MQKFSKSTDHAVRADGPSARRALNSTDGFQVGVGPSVVVLDEGTARSITSATLTSGVYAFVFGQQGLMAGAGLQGTKITQLNYERTKGNVGHS
jgi:lipid-binding SYLF domain-containing protein